MIKTPRLLFAAFLLGSGLAAPLARAASPGAPADAEPATTDREVQAAGALHIRLTDSSGAPLPGCSLHYHRPNHLSDNWREHVRPAAAHFSPRTTDEDGRLVVTGLPLDADCQIVAAHASIYTLSPVVRLTAAEPSRPLEWAIPEGTLYRGRLITPDGAPAAGIKLRLRYQLIENVPSKLHMVHKSTGFAHKFSLSTDAQGEFQLPLNFDMPGDYSLLFASRKDWQPLVIKLEREAALERQTFRLQRGHTLSGRVLDADTKRPVPDIELRADYHWESYQDSPVPPLPTLPFRAEEKTDAEGRFRFSTLPSGHFRISAFAGDLEGPVITVPMIADAPVDLLFKRR